MRLNSEAREQLQAAGITEDQWARENSTYLWCGYRHDGECGPGACPPHVTLRKGRKFACGCISHDPVDHQAGCRHCGAGEDEWCKPGCPVGEADREWAEKHLSTSGGES